MHGLSGVEVVEAGVASLIAVQGKIPTSRSNRRTCLLPRLSATLLLSALFLCLASQGTWSAWRSVQGKTSPTRSATPRINRQESQRRFRSWHDARCAAAKDLRNDLGRALPPTPIGRHLSRSVEGGTKFYPPTGPDMAVSMGAFWFGNRGVCWGCMDQRLALDVPPTPAELTRLRRSPAAGRVHSAAKNPRSARLTMHPRCGRLQRFARGHPTSIVRLGCLHKYSGVNPCGRSAFTFPATTPTASRQA